MPFVFIKEEYHIVVLEAGGSASAYAPNIDGVCLERDNDQSNAPTSSSSGLRIDRLLIEQRQQLV